jgi:sporulation protein YlmC with PRC-barrel domain
MLINSKSLGKLPVRTQSGTRLGRVASFDVDVDAGKISVIHVTPGVAARLLSDELMIAWSQIVSISAEAVIVIDSMVPVGATRLARAQET